MISFDWLLRLLDSKSANNGGTQIGTEKGGGQGTKGTEGTKGIIGSLYEIRGVSWFAKVWIA